MGPLTGYRIIELAGLGPCPMAGMLFADMGAEVICIDRSAEVDPQLAKDISRRGKKSIILNLKSEQGREVLLKLIESADALIEGYRPGVMERLGVGPDECLAINPALVYGRMTGWGQTGPLASNAGHDINYIAVAGALHAIGPAEEKPVIPLNIVGDYGGGSMFLTTGVLAALLEAKNSGKGQVVDTAMVDCVANLMWPFLSMQANKQWDLTRRGVNLLDGGAFFYDSYEAADGKYVAVGAIEPQFFTTLVELAGLDEAVFNLDVQHDKSRWPELKDRLAEVFKQKTQAQWCALLEDSNACFSPVLTAEEAIQHPHSIARNTYVNIDDIMQPAPAPRFNRTSSQVQHGQHQPGEDTVNILKSLKIDDNGIQQLLSGGGVA
jgi:alpha-methylacyl-CoA racemase